MYDLVRNAIEQSISLNILQESGIDILNCLNEHWNELIQSVIEVKNQLLNNLNGNILSEVAEQLKLWMTEIHNAYSMHPIQNANSIPDLQLLKNELWVSCQNLLFHLEIF